jgi:hypothetical protein
MMDKQTPDIATVEDLDLQQFLAVFSRYLPNLAADRARAKSEMKYLKFRIAVGFTTIKRAEERKKIPPISSAVKKVSSFNGVDRAVLNEMFERAKRLKPVDQKTRNYLELLDFVGRMRWFRDLRQLDETLDLFQSEAKLAVDAVRSTGGTNWTAVAAIVGLRRLWRVYTGEDGPVSPTRTGLFADYLSDGWDYLSIEGDLHSARKRWAIIFPNAVESSRNQTEFSFVR